MSNHSRLSGPSSSACFISSSLNEFGISSLLKAVIACPHFSLSVILSLYDSINLSPLILADSAYNSLASLSLSSDERKNSDIISLDSIPCSLIYS